MVDVNSLSMVAEVPSKLPKSQKPTNHVVKSIGTGKVSPWGKDNKEPQNILADIRNTPALQSVLNWKGRMLYGNGCYLAAATDLDANGNEILKPIKDDRIQQFLDRSYFEQYIRAACANYYQLENLFPEMILTKDKKEIYSINRLKTAFCRWGVQNQSTGLIDKLFYHSDWAKAGVNASDAAELNVLNEYDPFNHLQEIGAHKVVYRYRDYCADDRIYYNEPSWGSIRNSDWLNVAQQIPVFKKYLFENQAAIKYEVQTTREWWTWKYKGFEDMKQEDRMAIMIKEKKAFETTMAGNEGAGKSLFTTGFIDGASGKFIPGWTIKPLTNKFGSNDYLEDMQEATAQMLIALNVPPSLMGISPGKKFGAGSGSDVRELYNMYMAMQELERDLILEPWYLAFRKNGYPSDIRMVFKYAIITTLDKNHETQISSNGTAQ